MKEKNAAFEKQQYNEADPWNKGHKKCGSTKHREILKSAVSSLVEEGKLSQEKANQIEQFAKERAAKWMAMSKEERKAAKKEHKASYMKELIEKNIITENEAQLIRAKTMELKQQHLSCKLDALIEKGVITEADSKNIQDYLIKFREERKNEMLKLREMSEKERNEYFEKHKKNRIDIFDKMVEDGIINKKQASELKKVLFH